jgi:hypothetical protein
MWGPRQNTRAFLVLAAVLVVLPDSGCAWTYSYFGKSGYAAHGCGMLRSVVPGSVIGAPVCEPGSKYSLTMSDLKATMPDFVAPSTASCGTRLRSVTNPTEGCQWSPGDFLSMVYDRGVEGMRVGVPQEDAFKVYVPEPVV